MNITAMAVHRKAQSSCCSAPLNEAAAEAPHEHDCSECGNPTTRVLGEPRYIPASGHGVIALPEAAEGSEA